MSFVAEWGGPIEGYVVNYLTREHWKIARTCPREDAMQEAYCVFLRCKRKYPDVTEAKHFMALFKRAWFNHFTDLANADTERRVEGPMPTGADGQEFEQAGETDNDGSLAVAINQSPREVQMVLSLFLNAPQELIEMALGSWKGADRRFHDGGSEKINKLLGLPKGLDSVKLVVDYFS